MLLFLSFQMDDERHMMLREKARRLIAETKKGIKPDLNSLYCTSSESVNEPNFVSNAIKPTEENKEEIKEQPVGKFSSSSSSRGK